MFSNPKSLMAIALLCCALLAALPAAAQKMEPSIYRKITLPSKDVLDYLKTFDRLTELNPTKKVGNIVFSTQIMTRGEERSYKLKSDFMAGEEIQFRAYRPARHLDLMNLVSKQSISKGVQVEIIVCREDGTRIDKLGEVQNFKFISSFDLDELERDQNRSAIVCASPEDVPEFSPKFEETMKKLGPGKYVCKVYMFDLISPGKYQDRDRPLVWHTKDAVYYLVSAGQFTYTIK